jgi:Leucine-rich repeat (LRR) protein
LPNLEILDLSHNSISQIASKLFAKNPNLKVSEFTEKISRKKSKKISRKKSKKNFREKNPKKFLPKKILRFLT